MKKLTILNELIISFFGSIFAPILIILSIMNNAGIFAALIIYITSLWMLKTFFSRFIIVFHGKAKANFVENLNVLIQRLSVSDDPKMQEIKFAYKKVYLSLDEFIKTNKPIYIYEYVVFVNDKLNELLKDRNLVNKISKKDLLISFKIINIENDKTSN